MLKIYLKPIITYILAASFLLVAMASSCFSQPYCKVRTFTIDDGLPANNISEFGLSDDGMMWVSTWNGLCNYDGYKFSRFREHFGAGLVLTSNRLKFISVQTPAATSGVPPMTARPICSTAQHAAILTSTCLSATLSDISFRCATLYRCPTAMHGYLATATLTCA